MEQHTTLALPPSPTTSGHDHQCVEETTPPHQTQTLRYLGYRPPMDTPSYASIHTPRRRSPLAIYRHPILAYATTPLPPMDVTLPHHNRAKEHRQSRALSYPSLLCWPTPAPAPTCHTAGPHLLHFKDNPAHIPDGRRPLPPSNIPCQQ